MSVEVSYNIAIKTSAAYKDAETNASVFLNLVSNDGADSTGYLEIDNFWKNDFERGEIDKFQLKTKNVGLPLVVGIKIVHQWVRKDTWYCDYVEIDFDGKKAFYPVYDWIEDELHVTKAEAILPQNSSNYIRHMRRAEVERNKHDYAWLPTPTQNDLAWGLPRYLNAARYVNLPLFFKRIEAREVDRDKNDMDIQLDTLGVLQNVSTDPIDELSDYHNLYRRQFTDRQATNYIDNWDTDKRMGQQVLTGISPLQVSQCRELPDYFNVKNSDVIALLGENTTLEEQMKAGKCYIVDFNEKFKTLPRNVHLATKEPLHCPNAVGLFHVNAKGDFLPIAIQLVPGDRDYLFTPADSKDDWLLAKMYFRTAESSLHEWDSHLFSTHVIMEPFSIALFRCFPRCHPLYKMLRPHLQTVVAINTDGRVGLIAPGSATNGTVAIASAPSQRYLFKNITMDDLDIEKRLKKQGIDDPKLLPNFHYRDDAIALWRIMETYVRNMICHYYKTDEDVCNDNELQDFAKDVVHNGLGWQDGNSHGMPDEITTVEKLIEICHSLMFTSSAQHAAVNFGQYETYRFVPNCPLSMRLPPHRKGEATMQRILQSLPDATIALIGIGLAYTLSAFLEGEEAYLGEYPDRHFNEPEIFKIREEYRSELREAGEKIRKRNEGLEHPYTWLYPDRVPNYISI
ncbi:allene oxide synthase-lipoxygenase protein-like isoform X2 [Clavelina lepadiformis]|uniref:allene oxide synthase-lipoxygenase protein-like isoform X2 n=1 Tax=Clavelina lepadiformis TaxID=159417 RepID=UPI0040424E82